MLIAVAKKKAKMAKLTGSKKEPREDLVTSAIFGALQLLPQEDQAHAIADLTGENCIEGDSFDILFWPRWDHCEPDIVIEAKNKSGKICAVIVFEVKWGANLGDNQLERQKADSENKYGNDLASYYLLGFEAHKHAIDDSAFHPILWRGVTGRLQNAKKSCPDVSSPLNNWRTQVLEFLQQTDKGHIFSGFEALGTFTYAQYVYDWAGKPPWFEKPYSSNMNEKYIYKSEE